MANPRRICVRRAPLRIRELPELAAISLVDGSYMHSRTLHDNAIGQASLGEVTGFERTPFIRLRTSRSRHCCRTDNLRAIHCAIAHGRRAGLRKRARRKSCRYGQPQKRPVLHRFTSTYDRYRSTRAKTWLAYRYIFYNDTHQKETCVRAHPYDNDHLLPNFS